MDKMLEKDVPSLVDTNETDVSSTTIPVPDGKLLLPLLAQAHEGRIQLQLHQGVQSRPRSEAGLCQAVRAQRVSLQYRRRRCSFAVRINGPRHHDPATRVMRRKGLSRAPTVPPSARGHRVRGHPNHRPQHHQGAADVILSFSSSASRCYRCSSCCCRRTLGRR